MDSFLAKQGRVGDRTNPRLAKPMIRRQRSKTDANHGEIVRALRAAGCGVIDLSALGNGCPDILIHEPCAPWAMWLVEIKDGKRPPSERRLTPDQEAFFAAWKGNKAVVKSVDEALRIVSP